MKPKPGTICGAEISECGLYRYRLTRTWDTMGTTLAVIGLNPSTADATTDDRTIAKLTRLAKKWGHGSLTMVNLFAYRATDPKVMKKAAQPIGPLNDEWLERATRGADTVLAAWGGHGAHLSRGLIVKARIEKIKPLHVLRLSETGHPWHPLYLPETIEPVLWH